MRQQAGAQGTPKLSVQRPQSSSPTPMPPQSRDDGLAKKERETASRPAAAPLSIVRSSGSTAVEATGGGSSRAATATPPQRTTTAVQRQQQQQQQQQQRVQRVVLEDEARESWGARDVVVLMVAEKPSVASAIAHVLSHGTATARRGISPANAVHEFRAPFRGVRGGALFRVTSVTGHVYSVDFAAHLANWDSAAPVELFTAPVRKVEANAKLPVCRHLQAEARGACALVLWLDCDREGENICFEVMQNVVPNLDRPARVYRARFSSITAPDIAAAMAKLTVGVAFTRFQTLFFRDKYGGLDASLISYGPCQMPTLGFCVDRYDEIQAFVPQPFWYVEPVVDAGGRALRLAWARHRVMDRGHAVQLFKGLKDSRAATLEAVKEKETRRARPVPLNTVELLKVASQKLRLGPQHTMLIAERLYTSGYISYPRTESSAYPAAFDIVAVLKEHAQNRSWHAPPLSQRELLSAGLTAAKEGVDMGDHPPITPMTSADEGVLGADEWRLYEYIARHFIASVSPDCRLAKTKATFSIGGEQFKISGSRVTSPGFTAVLPWSESHDVAMPDFSRYAIPSQLAVTSIELLEGKTSPPDFLTESELISLMEKNGIGTDASIPVHINNICERHYAKVDQAKRTIAPTKLGIALVHGYLRIDPELVRPAVRANIERSITRIAKGEASFEEVTRDAVAEFTQKFKYFSEKIALMDELFEASFSTITETEGKLLTRCALCRRFMSLISRRPTRLYCETCQKTYTLPQGGIIKETGKGLVCPLDRFELVMYTSGPGERTRAYNVCPNCYNSPQIEDMPEGCGCNRCPNPDCPQSCESRSLFRCPECDVGTVVLDPTGPPKWRGSCNMCNFLMVFPDSTIKVEVLDDECAECGATKARVEFKAAESPLPGKQTQTTVCLLCDEFFASLGRGRGRRGGYKH
eukprot:m51a1_g12521 putative dna topoisomerase 3-beta-1 (925) ;mRNA; f:67-3603